MNDPQSFDRMAEDYDFVASFERRPDFFLEHLPRMRRRVLDVGCGSGILALELARHFDSVLGIDVSLPMLELARRKRSAPNVEYRIGDANALELEGRFDAIVSHTTFHHLADVGATLARLRTHLEPGGRMILVDNCPRSPLRPTFVLRCWALFQFPRDCVHHGLPSARRMLRFRLSESWLQHLATDRYLSASGFRDVYGAVLPGARFTRLPYFMGVVWEAPLDQET